MNPNEPFAMNPNAHCATIQTLFMGHFAIIVLALIVGGLLKGYRSLRHATKKQIANAFLVAVCILFVITCEAAVYSYIYRWIVELGVYE